MMFYKILDMYREKKEVINYIIFGILTTFINIVTYFILSFFFLDVNKVIELQVANVISWFMAVIFAYITNRKYVFDSDNKNVIREVFSFFISRIVTLLFDMLIMYMGVNILKINDKMVKVISQGLVIVSNYILSKVFVFKKK